MKQTLNAVLRFSKITGVEVMVISDNVEMLSKYIEGMTKNELIQNTYHIQKDIRVLVDGEIKAHKDIMCGHENAESYSCVDGSTFYGDLCEDCIVKYQDILDFENNSGESLISDIRIKEKYDDWDIFSRIVKK